MRTTYVVALLALLYGAGFAADETPAAPEAAPAETGTQAPVPAGDPGAATPSPASKQQATSASKSPESFVPSEEISEDLSVSFPVDI
ncbi:MAG: hypothetical protein HYR49_08625 [Gammaproteobacteria bacterium]|nr:hypothetical protein [Gammaproteobacteria bacterium]